MTPEKPLTIGIDIRIIGKKRTGDEVVFFQLVRELIRRHDACCRYELYTDETDDDTLASLRIKLEAIGRSDIEILSIRAANRFIWNAIAMPWRLLRRPVDVFHTQYILPLWLPRRLKVVAHVHDVSFRVHPEWIGRWDHLYLACLMPRTFSRSDRIIAPSEFTRSEILKQYSVPGDRVVVVENAAAEEWFHPARIEDIERTVRRFGLERGQYFISSGTLQPRKNIPFLITTFTQAVKERGLPYPLVLTGNPAGHNVDSTLQKTSDESIRYVGYVSDDDIRSLVAGARGSIVPSLYEGFGLPIEEALAVGTPVLAADIPVFHEVGRDRIQFFDSRTLAPAVENLYNFAIDDFSKEHLQERISGQTTIYSWPRSAEKLVQLYQKVGEDPVKR